MTTTASAGICLIEDDPIMGEALSKFFLHEQLRCDWLRDLSSAERALTRADYCALISDIRLPDGHAGQFYREMLERGQQLPPTLFITGYGQVQEAVELLKQGARDYITKPFEPDELLIKLRRACPRLFEPSGQVGEQVLGVSPVMRRLEQLLDRVAQHGVPVLITGESGVGKEHAACFLHERRCRRQSLPFVAVNCAAVPADLFEAELFGTERGAFTGSVGTRIGLFEQAGKGSLFLDEVGELPLALQAKLLRVVQERRFRRIGGRDDIGVNAVLIWATNRDLAAEVAAGRFREDLYFRISTVEVEIPPLRQRPADIPWFAHRFIDDFSREHGRHCMLTPRAEQWLLRHPWDGNVRALKQAIERAAIFSETGLLEPENFTATDALGWMPDPAIGNETGLRDYLADCERWYILRALEQCDGRICETADLLGISRKGLWERMNRLAIERPEPSAIRAQH